MTTASFTPRPSQARILAYTGGKLGVSAVPGSGKTWTLSQLAAKLVREAPLARGQQVLVVTLVNAARGKFEQQVRAALGENHLGTMYRVRTLHGLANDIVSERPGLVGLADDFQIIDDFAAYEIIREAVRAWFEAHKDFGMADYLNLAAQNRPNSLSDWREEAKAIATDFIKRAKDYQQKPEMLRQALDKIELPLPLAEMCVNVYEAYERGLRYRAAVDFQDLIRLALEALTVAPDYLERLRARWPYVLEDEAQDSSELQEQVLRLLVGENGNWVRVGDPNQAIYETFTTANPKFLRRFLTEPGVTKAEIPESSRSAPAIIATANNLIEWSIHHPHPHIQQRWPLTAPKIEAADTNPPDTPRNVFFLLELKLSAELERDRVSENLARWLANNPDKTVAVLLPTNRTGAEMVKVLESKRIPYVEMLKSTSSTRQVAKALRIVTNFLANPCAGQWLSDVFRVWSRPDEADPQTANELRECADWLKRLPQVEQFTAPRDRDYLLDTLSPTDDAAAFAKLAEFRALVQRWQGAVLLPADQLLLTLAADLFHEAADLATAYAIALHVRSFVEGDPEHRLAECVRELLEIELNRRTVLGAIEEDEEFDPTRYRGQVVVMTTHRAKGLEWDRVYLMSANNYDFPSADPQDTFLSERYFARDHLNLRAEALAQLATLAFNEKYVEGQATYEARIEYCAERLRLLDVALTRAKCELIVTWNTGKQGTLVPAKPLHHLAQGLA
jgi:DNA helicase-2/ATP-dependent DNA helicase PcrA